MSMTKQLHMEGLFGSTAELWEAVVTALRHLPGKRSQDEWLQSSRAIRLDEDELTVELPHKFARDFIEKRYRQAIEETLNNLVGKKLHLRFVVAEQTTADADPENAESSSPEQRTARSRASVGFGHPLNPRYRFDAFAVGETNAFAWQAAKAVADNPGGSYNPLVLCGGVGVGKTHLIQAIGHEIARAHPGLRVGYVSADIFTYEFVTAIRERRCDGFRKRYRTLDVWLVDDLQFIAQKQSTEEEFYLTFTTLYEAGHQIIVCVDRYPKDLPFSDNRLRSRLENGLIVELRPPDLETRVSILRRKAESEGAQISEDVLLFIANMVDSNVRTLEGALIKLLAYSSLTRRAATEALAREVLEGYFGKRTKFEVTLDAIQQATCDFFHVDLKAIRSKRRDKGIVVPRQVAMYLCRQATESSLAEIGQHFGGRDHSTVIAACNKIRDSLERDSKLRDAIATISQSLGVPQ